MSQYNIIYLCIDKINKEMTLQQLEYIIAVEQHGYFVAAADACGVTQSTLSLMIKKLEDELDVKSSTVTRIQSQSRKWAER